MTAVVSLKDRRKQAAQFLEVEESAIQTVEIQYSKLRQLGLLVDIEVRGLRALAHRAVYGRRKVNFRRGRGF